MIIRFPKNSIIRVIRVICFQDKQRIGLIPTTDYTDYKRISQRLNSKPKIVNSKPKTVNRKPKTVNSKLKTVN